jgi:hypothetical protein
MNTRHLPVPSFSSLNNTLRTICAVLLVLNVVTIIYSFASIPLFYQRAIDQTLPDIQIEGLLPRNNASVAQEADSRGLSIPDYLRYRIAITVLYCLGFYIVAFLILLRARGQWFLWFTALVLLFIPGGQLHYYAPLDRDFQRYLIFLSLLWPAVPLFLYLFPNGRAVPGWLRWLIGPILIVHLAFQGLAGLAYMSGGRINLIADLTPFVSVILLSLPLALIGQVYRYVRVSSGDERLQTKWVLGGMTVFIAGGMVLSALLKQFDTQADYGFGSDNSSMLFLLLPITIGISVLRYRLYDIDLIIRRGAVYGLLTALLSLVYFGSVITLQQVFRGTSGQSSPVAVVISTLLIAALFTPLRSRLQLFIDRRFFRKKYDAEKTLEDFSARLRHEVDLDEMNKQLLLVIEDSIQPEKIIVWMNSNTNKRQEVGG